MTMNRTLYFNHIAYDSVALEPGRTTYDMFQTTGEDHASVTGITELEAVEWLMGFRSFRDQFVSAFFRAPGQDPLRPERSVAFECKRVKALSESKSASKVNNAGPL
jgi:hypothetical protein